MNTEIYKLYNIDYFKEFDKYFKFFKDINESNIDYKSSLPDFEVENFDKRCKESKEELLTLDKEYNFTKLFNSYKELFSNLTNCRIDLLAYKAFSEIEKNESVLSTLKSFKPKNSVTKIVEYDTTSIITGRLVVKSGPKILTLPSKYRSILKSSYQNGNIYSIDFSSLEPRIAGKLSEKNSENDIYAEISDLLSFNADRSIIKKAVISSIYGANYRSLEGLSNDRSKEIFDAINDYFDFAKILELSKNVDEQGIRRNYFGRPLWNLNEKRENVLINNYIQSSAVDVALKYFTELSLNNHILKPLFILHDALIVDISDENYDDVFKIINNGYDDDKLGYFPLKLEKFNI